MSADFVSLLMTFILMSSFAANPSAKYNNYFNYEVYYKRPQFSNPCYGEYGCFNTGPPFYHPKYRPITVPPAKNTVTKFLLFKPSNRDTPIEMQPTKESIQKAKLDSDHFYIIIHDYLVKDLADYIAIKDSILNHNYTHNIIMVDWTHDNSSPIWQAIANARITAVKVAKLLAIIMQESKNERDRIVLVGHGLGAHLAGYVGKQLNKTAEKPSNCNGGIGFNIKAGRNWHGKKGGNFQANFGRCWNFNLGGPWNNNVGRNVKTNIGRRVNNIFGGRQNSNMRGGMYGNVGFGVNDNVRGKFRTNFGRNFYPNSTESDYYSFEEDWTKKRTFSWKNNTFIQIDALDPYGPYFFYSPSEIRLSHTDANHVQVIHTNGGVKINEGLGLFHKIGIIDFYPNNGKNQPGCGEPTTIVESGITIKGNNCSHNFAVKLYAASIDYHYQHINLNGCQIYGRVNATWETFLQSPRDFPPSQQYDPREFEAMGFHNYQLFSYLLKNNGRDDKYFLITSGKPPYCIKDGWFPPPTTAAPPTRKSK